MISIFIFYILHYQSYIYILHQRRLIILILRIKEVKELPGGGTPALNVMAIQDQRHAKIQ